MEGGAVNLYKDFFPTTLHLAPKINGNVWSLGTLAVLTVVLVFGMILGFLLATSIYDANFYATLWSISMFSKSGKDHTSSVTSLLENSKYEVESGNRTALVSKKVTDILLLHLLYPIFYNVSGIGTQTCSSYHGWKQAIWGREFLWRSKGLIFATSCYGKILNSFRCVSTKGHRQGGETLINFLQVCYRHRLYILYPSFIYCKGIYWHDFHSGA